MRGKSAREILAFLLAAGLMLSGMDGMGSQAMAAGKKATVKLNKTKISIKKGKKTTLKIVAKNVKKIVSAKWSSKDKKVATVSGKGKVTGKKAGKSTTITCKVKYQAKNSKKTKTKKLTCKVTIKKDAAQPSQTAQPTQPAQTAKPVQPTGSPKPSSTADPSQAAGGKALAPQIMRENQIQQNPYLSAEESMIHNDIYNSDVRKRLCLSVLIRRLWNPRRATALLRQRHFSMTIMAMRYLPTARLWRAGAFSLAESPSGIWTAAI